MEDNVGGRVLFGAPVGVARDTAIKICHISLGTLLSSFIMKERQSYTVCDFQCHRKCPTPSGSIPISYDLIHFSNMQNMII